MNKVKKVFISFGLFITGLISKVSALSALSLVEQVKYGEVEIKYGVFEPTMGEKILRVGKVVIPIILFVIGLFVVLSKKTTKKVKTIIISGLVILAILGYVLMNYIATNF